MIDLEKWISGDWIDIREAARDLDALGDHFRLSEAELQAQIRRLGLAVEEGIVEYKRSLLLPLFTTLEQMKYQSVSSSDLEAYRRSMDSLLYTIMIQKLLASGTIPASRPAAAEAPAAGTLDIQSIVADIHRRAQADPRLLKHPAVKNILMQFQIYRREWEKMQELAPNIREEKEATFRDNFRAVFNRSFESIRRHYAGFLLEGAERRSETQRLDPLRRLPLRELVPLLLRQARQVSRLRSTLRYAVEKKHRTREILVRAFEKRREVLDLLEMELGLYRELSARLGRPEPEAGARSAAARMRDEVARVLEWLARDRQKAGR